MRRTTLLVLVLPVLIASCKLGEPGPEQPAAEVSASNERIRLTLRLHETRVKSGEPFWYQISMTNVSSKRIWIVDDIFQNIYAQRSNRLSEMYTYVLAEDSTGKPVPLDAVDPFGCGADNVTESREPDPAALAKIRPKVERWKKQGLSLEQINEKLAVEPSDPEQRPKRFSIELEPGQSITSKAMVFQESCDKKAGKPPRQAVGEFSQLWIYGFEQPGKYRLRLVHNTRVEFGERINKILREALGDRFIQGGEILQTPWVEVEVQP